MAYTVSATVANAGATHAGKAVVQAYVQHPGGSAYDTPAIQLRDFVKTDSLAASSGTQAVELSLTRRDLSVWDTELQNWVVPAGEFRIWLGWASDDLPWVCSTSTGTCEEADAGPV